MDNNNISTIVACSEQIVSIDFIHCMYLIGLTTWRLECKYSVIRQVN